jgi:hypothetical protein
MTPAYFIEPNSCVFLPSMILFGVRETYIRAKTAADV